jgi:isopentenyldiphosphate isomerase
MIIPIVDKNDRIICYKDRNDKLPEDMYRVTALWITNSKGEILLAKRALNVRRDPGRWGPSVAGTVEKGETYNSNIIKEAYEEIGLKDIKPKKGIKRLPTKEHNHFAQWYFLTIDKDVKDFKLDPIEVAEVKWSTKEYIIKDVKQNPSKYVKGMPEILKDIYIDKQVFFSTIPIYVFIGLCSLRYLIRYVIYKI